MGMLKPEVGEFVRICVELKGTEGLTQEKYEDWKDALKEVAHKFGATYKPGEHIIIPKARKKKRG